MDNYENNFNQENGMPYGNPYGTPQSSSDPGKNLAITASFLGVASIAMSFFMPVGVPMILAVVTIVLAILSQGKNESMQDYSKRALRFGIIGLVVHLGIMAAITFTSYKMITDPSMRLQANQVMEQMYGYSLDDVLQTLDQEYGTDLLHADGSAAPTIM